MGEGIVRVKNPDIPGNVVTLGVRNGGDSDIGSGEEGGKDRDVVQRAMQIATDPKSSPTGKVFVEKVKEKLRAIAEPHFEKAWNI